jgi:hypothetical protein
MSDCDILLRWLERAAGRRRLNERLQEVIWLVITLLALAIVYQALDAGLAMTKFSSGMLPLFLAAGAAATVYFGWRMASGPVLTQAASRADASAGLNDELRSALWFAHRETQNGFVRVHLDRAARTVQRLDVRQLFPVVMPRNFPMAIFLALFAGALSWVLPHLQPITDDSQVAPARSAESRSGVFVAGESVPEKEDSEVAATREFSEAAWLKVENLARELTAGPSTEDIAQAIEARDAKTAARLLAGMRRKQAAQPASGAAARPETEQMSATLAKDIIDRLQSLLNEGGGSSPNVSGGQDGDNTERLTEQVSRDLRDEMDDAQQSLPGELSPEEQRLNTALRAMSRESRGGREAVRGESPPMQGAGRTSVGSGAMGRRISNSSGGAGDGEQPRGNPDGNAEAEPVFGRKTMRLRMQLQTVKIDSVEPEGGDGTEESFYAATQAQAAKTEYETVTAAQSGGTEQITGRERLPLAYRDAVKRYTLRQHRRDEQQAVQERAAR